MIIYFFPNDDIAIIYCFGRISLLNMKLMLKSPLFRFEIALSDS